VHSKAVRPGDTALGRWLLAPALQTDWLLRLASLRPLPSPPRTSRTVPTSAKKDPSPSFSLLRGGAGPLRQVPYGASKDVPSGAQQSVRVPAPSSAAAGQAGRPATARPEQRRLAASAVACVVGKGEEACCTGREMAILPKQEFWPVSMTDQTKSLAAEGNPGRPAQHRRFLVSHASAVCLRP
jgi:hypothetical protein